MSGGGLGQRLLRKDRLITVGVLALAVLIAAAYIMSGGGTGMSAISITARTGPAGALLASTPDMIMQVDWTLGYVAIVFVMWWLMMIAMMVPSAAPTILLYAALNSSRGAWAPVLFSAGYLAIWGIFSGAATAAQAAFAQFSVISAMLMTVTAPWLGAAILVGAGMYQFTPLKAACLHHCRGPVEALTRHRRTGRAAAFRMGLVHGRYCLGCCWSLMALLFVGGIMNIWWILGIAIYVAIEKLAPGGDRLAQPMGAILILVGIGLLIGRIV